MRWHKWLPEALRRMRKSKRPQFKYGEKPYVGWGKYWKDKAKGNTATLFGCLRLECFWLSQPWLFVLLDALGRRGGDRASKIFCRILRWCWHKTSNKLLKMEKGLHERWHFTRFWVCQAYLLAEAEVYCWRLRWLRCFRVNMSHMPPHVG